MEWHWIVSIAFANLAIALTVCHLWLGWDIWMLPLTFFAWWAILPFALLEHFGINPTLCDDGKTRLRKRSGDKTKQES